MSLAIGKALLVVVITFFQIKDGISEWKNAFQIRSDTSGM